MNKQIPPILILINILPEPYFKAQKAAVPSIERGDTFSKSVASLLSEKIFADAN